jgi:hypothetical protein
VMLCGACDCDGVLPIRGTGVRDARSKKRAFEFSDSLFSRRKSPHAGACRPRTLGRGGPRCGSHERSISRATPGSTHRAASRGRSASSAASDQPLEASLRGAALPRVRTEVLQSRRVIARISPERTVLSGRTCGPPRRRARNRGCQERSRSAAMRWWLGRLSLRSWGDSGPYVRDLRLPASLRAVLDLALDLAETLAQRYLGHLERHAC